MLDAFISALLSADPGGGSRIVAPSRGAVVAQAQTPDDATVVKRAKVMLAGLQTGKIDRTQLSPALAAEYTPDVVANEVQLLPKGTPSSFAIRQKFDVDGVTTYVFRVHWDAGTVDYAFGFDDATLTIVKLYTRPGPPC